MTRPDVLVVGAGVVGLMTAYELARRGGVTVRVVDAAPSLLLGASGRNGGGVRAQWTSEENIELARRSIASFRDLSAQTGYNTWFRQGGYLLVARTTQKLERLRRAVDFQRRHDVPTRLLSAREAQEIVPALDASQVAGAAYNPDDGTLFPWPVVHGVAEKCKALGVDIRLGVRVDGFHPVGDRVLRADTSAGPMEADHFVVAVGARTKQLVAGLGIDLPTRPERHEILVTEALKPFLDPMLVDLEDGLYASQAMRGELVGGLGRPHVEGHDWESSFEFTAHFARSLIRLLPRLSGVNVLRQWAGSYDVTPDARPILGRVGPWENLMVACGFSGHGFMLSPTTGQVLADLILTGTTDLPMEKYGLGRFDGGAPENPETLVIG